MEITLVTPAQFTTVPWKNGKGETVELATSEGGSMACFDWRLSIASVTQDGEFSDFSGYERHLTLIEGEGILLTHERLINDGLVDDNHISHKLTQRLSVAKFDGGSKTTGKLVNGAIKDFNLMHDSNRFQAKVDNMTTADQVDLLAADLCFIYPLDNEAVIASLDGSFENITVAQAHLLKITELAANRISLSGVNLIVIYLFKQ